MEEHAKRVHVHHVPESGAGKLRLIERRNNSSERAEQRNISERSLIAAFVDQRIDNHHHHSKN